MELSLSTVQKKRFFLVSFSGLTTVAVCLGILTFVPVSRDFIRNWLMSNSRLILAKADADLTGNGQKISIIKVQSSDTLALEIFEAEGDGQKLQFVKRIILPEKKDAYFNFRGNTSNLVIADVDGDGILEIIAPAFDENLIPRLNVYKLNPENREFFRMNSDAVHL